MQHHILQKKDTHALSNLLSSGFKLTLYFSLVVGIILLIFSPIIAGFLHIDFLVLVILMVITITISNLTTFPSGILQGEMRFVISSVLNMINPLIKILISLLLLFLGWKIFGVFIATVLAFFIQYIFSLIVAFNKRPKKIKNENSEFFYKEFKKYSIGFFLASIGITVISNMDVILVRHFFPSIVAGQYAALSLMGKVIFYFTSPIYYVFFPLIAYKRERGENVTETLFLACGVIGLISLGIAIFYFLFPHIVLNIFYPAPAYAILTHYIGWFAFYMVVFSIVYLLNNYFLSIGKTGIYKLNLSAAIIFVLGIIVYHNNLFNIISVLFITSFLLLLSLLIYYRYHGRE